MDDVYLWFGCWRACDCTDVQPNRDDIPKTCPCHGGDLLGTDTVFEADAGRGHQCTLPPLIEVPARDGRALAVVPYVDEDSA